MARSGSDPFVERVREATDIAEVVGAHVELKRVGSRLQGLCPFHSERTASFYVNPALQAFHCFGCGVGGDVFSFVMDHEKMTFPEALRHLAERAGIPMPDRRGPATDQGERIREALRVARLWYQDVLQSGRGAEGQTYLDRREIRPETRATYGLGLAPDAWDGLLSHARSMVSERTLVEAGLVVEGDRGHLYDRFRHRLMIPLETPGGAPCGFGARGLGDQEPKYINSPETPVYRKGAVLFGVSHAREGVRAEGRVVLVEGYFDVMSLVQGGIGGAVGTCGTALTAEQATLLKRLSNRVVLLFDGDPAGVKAAIRALPILAGEVAEVRVAMPPEGIDPDLWLRQEGQGAVRRGLDAAKSPVAFLEDLVTRGHLSRSDGVMQASELVRRIPDPLIRDLWIQEASARFGIRVEAFYQKLRQGPASGRTSPGPVPAERRPRVLDPLELGCLRAALAVPSRAGELAEALEESGPYLAAGPGPWGSTAGGGGPEEAQEVNRPHVPELLRWIAGEVGEAGGTPLSAATLLSRAARQLPQGGGLSSLALGEGGAPDDVDEILSEIRRRDLRRRMTAVTRSVRTAEESGNQEELLRYLVEKQRLAEELARLSQKPPRPGSRPGGASDRETA